jgi:hypothetical protein
MYESHVDVRLILEIAGLVLLAGTLAYTAYAAHQAARAANAAREAVMAERAWLTLARLIHGYATNGEFLGKQFKTGFYFFSLWTNTGRSPAIKVRMQTAIRVLPTNSPIPRFDVDFSGDFAATIGPNVTGESPKQVIFGEDLDQFMSGKAFVYLYTVVDYFDVFDTKTARVSESCIRVSFHGVARQPDGSEEPNFMNQPVGPQNRVT